MSGCRLFAPSTIAGLITATHTHTEGTSDGFDPHTHTHSSCWTSSISPTASEINTDIALFNTELYRFSF